MHITASKGSSPGPCALCVRRENLTHKVISVKIFTLSLYGSLSRDANFGFFIDRFCGFWKLSQFPRIQKILWNNICNSKDMLQCSENILIGHSCFSVKKYAYSWSSNNVLIGHSCFSVKKVHIFLVFSKRER